MLAFVPVRKLILLLVALMVALTACGGGDDAKTKGRPKASEKSPTEPPKPKYCALNGKEVGSDFDADRPAVAIKVDNHPRARPQSGLDAADIVYEELAEGGITRFITIWYCTESAKVGPVRSARLVDPDILREYDPVLFGYSGAAPHVLPKVGSTQGVTDLRHGSNGKAYQRIGGGAPHNLYTGTDKLRALPAAEKVSGAPEIALEFEKPGEGKETPGGKPSASPAATGKPSASPAATGSPAAPAGTPANIVSFSFGGGAPSKYTFDPASGAYLRSHGDTPHNSAAGQIKVVNVVVIKVPVTLGKGSPEITVTGTGEAQVFKNGTAVAGTWSRPGLQDDTTIKDSTGATIKLAPGNTWIHLLPNSRPVTVQ